MNRYQIILKSVSDALVSQANLLIGIEKDGYRHDKLPILIKQLKLIDQQLLEMYQERVSESTRIPLPNTPEREKFNHKLLGTIGEEDGYYYCLKCRPIQPIGEVCLLYGINVAPYSLVCHKCESLIVEGVKKSNGEPLCIFG